MSVTESDHSEKKSPVARFLLILNVALPIAILVAGALIIRTPRLPNVDSTVQKNIIGVLFVIYAFYRFYQVYKKYQSGD